MALCPDSRWVRSWPPIAAALLVLVTSASAVDLSKWPGREAAIEQARKQGKLLLTIHVSAEFTQNAADSREAQVYMQAALADPRVEALLASRFVPTLRAVGETKHLRLKRTDKAAAQDVAIAYVCLPDERVLHFIPGFLSPADLLAELTWAEQCYAAMVKAPAYEQPLAMRQAHRARIDKADWAAFINERPARWSDDGKLAEGETTVDLPEVAARARSVFESALSARLPAFWQREEAAGALAALAAHGSLACELAHLILAEYPLVQLSDVAGPAYAATCGRRMFNSPKRRAELAAWWALSGKAGRSTLLVVADDDFYEVTSRDAAARNPSSGPQPVPRSGRVARNVATTSERVLEWPPAELRDLPGVSRLAVQVVTLDELAALLADSGLPEANYTRGQPLRYLLHDAHGFRLAELSGDEATTARLAEAIRNMDPGARAGQLLAKPVKNGATTPAGGKKNAKP